MLDILFPKICMLCENNASAGAVCRECYSTFSFINNEKVCKQCGSPCTNYTDNQNYLCGSCIGDRESLLTVRSVLLYRDKVIDLLHEFKYNSKIYVTDFISGEIIKNFPADISGFDVVVPVPLHINRLRDRGYNQTVLISRVLSRKFCKFLDLYSLKKIRDTDPQVQMSSFYSRAKNVKNSFRVDKNAQFLGKRILLLDDVYTSGSTVKECSRKLIEAGAKRVFALTLARAG